MTNNEEITELVKKQIEALDLPGIDFIPTNKRTYQMGSFASYIIGFASADDDGTITGKMGIEAYYDNELQGKDGYTIYQKDAMGYTIPNTTPITVDPIPGKDIYLTIDSKIKMFVENGIQEISKDNNMTWLTFSVIDAKTGAIVASASNPTFNLNTRQAENYLNPLTQYSYEPGSTMKIFSFMAAMENGVYNGNDTYASGTIQVDDAKIKDWNNYGIIVHSLKSSARTIGAVDVSELARTLELAGKNADTDTINRETPRLLVMYRELEEPLKNLDS